MHLHHAAIAVPLSLSLVVLTACGATRPGLDRAANDATSSRLARAAALYERHCALCHGPDGDGLGPASALLYPPPRDFGTGRFCLASTENGVPTDQDLIATLRRGMPGSAMPPFDWLPDDDLAGLAQHVRDLAVARLAAANRARMAPGEALATARERMTPAAVVSPPPARSDDPSSLALGQRLYLENCAACHGPDGRGRKPVVAWSETHDVRLARDFTAGILKGGASRQELAARITAGMPGSGMPPTRFDDPAELGALVDWVEQLVPAGTPERFRQRPVQLPVTKIGGVVPNDGDDPLWGEVPEREIALAPLVWRDDAILHARIAAVHDRDQVAFRIRWQDTTRDDRSLAATRDGDGVAVQFSAGAEVPPFGMGAADRPVNIWHWKAFRFHDSAGFLDLLDRPPHALPRTDAPVYRPAPGLAEASAHGGSTEARGFESFARARENELPVSAAPSWRDGEWQVVFRRELRARSPREVGLTAGARIRFALAIWNGAGGMGPTWKSVTIWHELAIEAP